MKTTTMTSMAVSVFSALNLVVAGATDSPPVPEGGETIPHGDFDRAFTMAAHAEWASRFRNATTNFALPGEGPHRRFSETPFFSTEGAARWRLEIESEPRLDELQLADFFMAAQVLVGGFDESGAVIGFYNPWWDALLVVETSGGSFRPGPGRQSKIPAVKRFRWVSGETFRGEAAGPTPSVSTVVPVGGEPLSAALWRARNGTVAAFDALYPPERGTEARRFVPSAFPDPSSSAMESEWNRIEARSAVRLRTLTLLADAPVQQARAGKIRDLLRTASRRMLRAHFRSPVHEFFVSSFASLPAELRSGFELYGYVPAETGTLFVFVNAELPRIYATVSFPPGDGNSEPDPDEVVFEWYDFDKAPELEKAWNEEKRTAAQNGRNR